MNYDNPFSSMMGKPKLKQILPVISIVIGAILAFISLFIGYPNFLFTLPIGVVLILYFVIYWFIEKNKNSAPRVKKTKTINPNKVQHVKKNPGDNSKVLATCPYCLQKMRLPNKKGKHGVDCPKCKNHFMVKI